MLTSSIIMRAASEYKKDNCDLLSALKSVMPPNLFMFIPKAASIVFPPDMYACNYSVIDLNSTHQSNMLLQLLAPLLAPVTFSGQGLPLSSNISQLKSGL